MARDVISTLKVNHGNTINKKIKKKKYFNPLNSHDALKHHFAYLKNDLIS